MKSKGVTGLAAIALCLGTTGASAKVNPDWDQAANIKSAAERLAKVHRAQGSNAAVALISACYKTQSLSLQYSAGFEACLAQDYIQTRVLVEIYSRISPDARKKLGAPSVDELAQSMAGRLTSGFASYEIPGSYVMEFKALVDEHGWPVFRERAFPNGKPGAVTPQGKRN